jgi:hypothetical protein
MWTVSQKINIIVVRLESQNRCDPRDIDQVDCIGAAASREPQGENDKLEICRSPTLTMPSDSTALSFC